MATIVVCRVCGEFPVHHNDRHLLEWVPWSLVESHAAQARSNHGHTLQQLAESGGLSLVELAAVLEDREWRLMPVADALAVVRAAVECHGCSDKGTVKTSGVAGCERANAASCLSPGGVSEEPGVFDAVAVATEVLRCALSHDPGSRIVGNVTALDLAKLASEHIITCPSCGAEAWVNIDCALCSVLGNRGEG